MKIIIIILLCALLGAVVWPQIDHRSPADKSRAAIDAAIADANRTVCEFHDPLHNTKRCK